MPDRPEGVVIRRDRTSCPGRAPDSVSGYDTGMKPALLFRVLAACATMCAATLHAQTDKPATPAFPATSTYLHKTIEGFPIMVDPRLAEETELCAATLKEISSQLYLVSRKVPAKALAKIRKVRIFVQLRSPTTCAVYHPSRRWLSKHKQNPDMARCVELSHPKAFLSWTKHQPWMLLHELAHAYHHQFLAGGFGNPEVRECFEAARESKSYESVLHIQGHQQRAYALTNHKEYFAEASEAFFGTNDMYPFVGSELRRHDPRMSKLLKKLWR